MYGPPWYTDPPEQAEVPDSYYLVAWENRLEEVLDAATSDEAFAYWMDAYLKSNPTLFRRLVVRFLETDAEAAKIEQSAAEAWGRRGDL